MSISVTVNGQSAVGVTASSGDSVAVSVGLADELVAITVSPSGAPGPVGPQGPQGSPATMIEVGTVTTGDPGTDVVITATPSNSGNTVTLDFEIPRGATGSKGSAGTTPAFAIGKVTTGAAGSSASVTATTTNGGANVTLDFAIPQGAAGSGGGGGAVSSVAGRTGDVTLAASDVSGLATIATSGSASDLAAGTVPVACLPAATTKALGAVQIGDGLSIASGVLSATGGVSWTTVPATPTSAGTAGQFAQDSEYVYACYASGQWLRVVRDPWILPPGAPTITSTTGDLLVVGGPGAVVSMYWDPPVDDGGELTGYLVQIDADTPVSVGPSTTTYTFSPSSFLEHDCNGYVVRVRAVNSAGESDDDTATVVVPATEVPTIYNIITTPNEGAPGVEFGVYWFPPCLNGPWNTYEVQARLYSNAYGVVPEGDEDGWEAFYSGGSTSHTAQISWATGSETWQFRCRAKNVVGGSVVSTSGWSVVIES